MILLDGLAALLLVVGAFFFLAGTVGILRLPDAHSRLHALTKADNVGLGFIVTGLMVQADSVLLVAKLGLIWVIALVASAAAAFLIAGTADQAAEAPHDHD
jgi:multicomponent Na+:H+ antiporter subunit G